MVSKDFNRSRIDLGIDVRGNTSCMLPSECFKRLLIRLTLHSISDIIHVLIIAEAEMRSKHNPDWKSESLVKRLSTA